MRWASNCLSKIQEIKKLRARVWVNRKQQQFGIRSQFQCFSTPLTIKATMMKIQAQLATRVALVRTCGGIYGKLYGELPGVCVEDVQLVMENKANHYRAPSTSVRCL
jgi:hypothetical protein